VVGAEAVGKWYARNACSLCGLYSAREGAAAPVFGARPAAPGAVQLFARAACRSYV